MLLNYSGKDNGSDDEGKGDKIVRYRVYFLV